MILLNAPKAIGPYSQAIKYGGLVYCSGQIGMNKDGNLISEDISLQTKQVLENIKAILVEANSSLEKVLKVEIFLTDIKSFSLVNDIYAEYFSSNIKPARLTVEVSNLPKNARIEISCIAAVL